MSIVIKRLGIVIVTCSALLLVACGEEPDEVEVIRPVRAMKVGDAAGLVQGALPGQAKATREVNLSFRVAGPLISFPIKVGDEVEAGDLLAQIDPRDFEVRLRSVEGQLRQVKSELEAMRIARPEDLARAEAKVRSAEADANLAGQELKRLQNIQAEDSGAIAQTMIDQAVAKKQAADATLINARKESQIAKKGARDEDIAAKDSEIASLQASVDAARDEVEYTYLKAPFQGTIVANYVENFEDVQAKEPILRLLDSTRIEMVINLPETAIANVPYVRNIRVRFDAFPTLEIPAKIKEIGTEASQTTRTYPITLIMDQPENAKILPGMAGKASADLPGPGDGSQGRVLIPVSSVFSLEESEDSLIWVIDPDSNEIARRLVKTGQLTSFGVAVTDGLSSGEWVVTAGVHSLREGQQVRILKQGDED